MRRVCSVDELPTGSMRRFDVNGRALLLVHTDSGMYAMDGLCSHMRGDLSKGTLEGSVVTCPRHGSKYDVRNGEVVKNLGWPLLGKAKPLRTFGTRVEGGYVMIDDGT